MIFTMQIRKLQAALIHHFRFVFVDAPFPSTPGPGVLPFFEDCGPFFRWVAHEGDDKKRTRAVLRAKMDEDGGKFVGVLGFSQGARQAAGILQEQQENGEVEGQEFRFGILVNGTYPALLLASDSSDPQRQLSPMDRSEWNESFNPNIRLPSVHIHGAQDPWLKNSRLLARCFDPDTAEVFEFENGHYLPTLKADNEKVADAILGIYHQGLWGGECLDVGEPEMGGTMPQAVEGPTVEI